MNKDPLFLSKKKNQEVFINIGHIPQHQIDGIRFLYQQFEKKKPGVIFNDPPGYGTCLQIVLFLNALQYLLDKRVFILCDEDDVVKWKKHFQERIELHDDVTFETTDRNGDKKVYINSMKNISSFCYRDWSVVVVDGNMGTKPKLKADFKIWITPVEMKSNLQLFTSIYQWMSSPNDFVIETINELKISEMDTAKTALNKVILLDALLQDIVIRRNNLDLTLSPELQNTTDKNIYHQKEMPKLSEKNKDSTGLKIKRTKRKLESKNRYIAVDNDSNIFFINDEGNRQNADNDTNIRVVEPHVNEIIIKENIVESLNSSTITKPEMSVEINDSDHEIKTEKKLDVCNTPINEIETVNKRNQSKNVMDFDAKYSELEEKALKKFKGSVLDSIF